MQTIVQDDPAVDSVVGFTGGRQTNSGFVYISLKPYDKRKITADEVVARLRDKLGEVAGARLFMVAVSDLRTGGRQSNATYQYTLLSDDTTELYTWAPRLTAALMERDVIKDVNSDQEQGGLQTNVDDRPRHRDAARPHPQRDRQHALRRLRPATGLDDLQCAEPVSRRHGGRAAILAGSADAEADLCLDLGRQSDRHATDRDRGRQLLVRDRDRRAPRRPSRPNSARNLATNALAASGHSAASAGAAVSTSIETMVPLSAFAKFAPGHTPLSVNHQGLFAAATISFNLAPGRSLSEARTEIDNAVERIGMPSTVRGAFAGTAATFQQSQSSMPLLFGAALVTIYLVLGILYESLIHPITILSTLFSASVGAALALWLFDTEFTIIAAIGVLLLIGIVKKNAIMMVDFALEAERQGRDTREAIEEACLLRFRPIMMTTFAALFGALPLAFGTGEGSELRHPLGITIVGGLIVSQVLTLYTTPVVFLYLDNFGKWLRGLWRGYYLRAGPAPMGAR